MTKFLQKFVVTVSIISFGTSVAAEAATIHHWRFEENPGFLIDSVGSSHLTGDAVQKTLPGSGAGSLFPDPLYVPGGGSNSSTSDFNGSNALSTTITPITTDFTVEAFVHLNSAVDTFAKCIVCSLTNPSSPSTLGFAFEARLDQYAETQERELTLVVSDGDSWTFLGSDFVLETDTDYYVASAFDLGGDVTFWIQDLTNGGTLQKVSSTHNVTALNPSPLLTIGDDGTEHFDFAIDGLIDEVRLSDSILTDDQLLVKSTLSTPEPSTLLGLGTLALAGGTLLRRKRKA